MKNIINLKSQVFSTVYNWCIENSLTPYIIIVLSEETKGLESFKDTNVLPLTLGMNSIINLNIFDTHIEFETRFNKVSTKVFIPLGNIISICPREYPDYGTHFLVDVDNKHYLKENSILDNEQNSNKKEEIIDTKKSKSFLSIVK